MKSKSCVDMPKRKKSKKRSKASTNMILVELITSGDYADSLYAIDKNKRVGFDITEVEPGAVPFVRATNHPVQRDPRKR
jgi:hypothetical protein